MMFIVALYLPWCGYLGVQFRVDPQLQFEVCLLAPCRSSACRSVYCWLMVGLHGIEASFLAAAGLRKLRAANVRVVWSRRQSCQSWCGA